MSEKIVFKDSAIEIEIYDSVMSKHGKTDYSQLDSTQLSYLKNRELIQPKLVAGDNILIDENNVISSFSNVLPISSIAVDFDPEDFTVLGGEYLGRISLNLRFKPVKELTGTLELGLTSYPNALPSLGARTGKIWHLDSIPKSVGDVLFLDNGRLILNIGGSPFYLGVEEIKLLPNEEYLVCV